MINRGRELLVHHKTLLARIEKRVRRTAALPGGVLGYRIALRSRAGLDAGLPGAGDPGLGTAPRDYFRGELFNALTMVQRGHIDAATMTGSWAGAMGQTQFMPSSYLRYAVDFDGDDRRDIWKSTPDALASMANYLKGFGWKDDETWGREVTISDDAQAAIADRSRSEPKAATPSAT